jgi:hypothetical protein
MAMRPYMTVFPSKIMEGASDELETVHVMAKSLKQAEERSFAKAIALQLITDWNDWRWQRRTVKINLTEEV